MFIHILFDKFEIASTPSMQIFDLVVVVSDAVVKLKDLNKQRIFPKKPFFPMLNWRVPERLSIVNFKVISSDLEN